MHSGHDRPLHPTPSSHFLGLDGSDDLASGHRDANQLLNKNAHTRRNQRLNRYDRSPTSEPIADRKDADREHLYQGMSPEEESLDPDYEDISDL